MAKAANNVPAPQTQGGQLPDYLRDMQKSAKVGNVDQTDFIIPRIKLLQKISPECDAYEAAKPGRFWHTVMNADLGPELKFAPILVRKTYVLWAPRNDDRGILARASDGIHWDIPDLTFTVKPKGSQGDVVYTLGKTVHDRIDGKPAMSEFGSGIPGNPQSPPAASLTYEILCYLTDFPDMSPAIILNTRSQVKPGKDLLTKIESRPVDHYYGQYLAGVVTEKGDEGDYYNFRYSMDGYVPQAVGDTTKGLFERFEKQSFRANDERDDEGDKANRRGGGEPDPEAHKGKKF